MNWKFIDPHTINALANSPIFTIAEFFAITVIVTCTYLGVRAMLGHLKEPTKVLISMVIGTAAYSFAKFFMILLLIEPYVDSFYVKPF